MGIFSWVTIEFMLANNHSLWMYVLVYLTFGFLTTLVKEVDQTSVYTSYDILTYLPTDNEGSVVVVSGY